MKFLVFSDTHGDSKLVDAVEKRAKDDDIDFVIIPGDFTNFSQSIKAILKRFNKFGKKIYLLPGNHEEGEEYSKTIKKHDNLIDLNKTHMEMEGYVFLGYGGDGFSLEDKEFRKLARTWYGNFKKKKVVLVTHGPPNNTKLDLVGKRHVGNKDYRKFIERIKPKLAICGHIHDTAGVVDKLGETKLINPCWEGMVIELN